MLDIIATVDRERNSGKGSNRGVWEWTSTVFASGFIPSPTCTLGNYSLRSRTNLTFLCYVIYSMAFLMVTMYLSCVVHIRPPERRTLRNIPTHGWCTYHARSLRKRVHPL